MAQITEDYVSYETSNLLKEKGFNWEVHRSYLVNNNVFIPGDISDVPLRKDAIKIPTHQMAMKWLRKVHHITIGITFSFGIITYEIQKDEEVIVAIGSSRSYEDMVEEAIKYCLENLI